MPNGTSTKSLIELLLSSYTGGAKGLTSEEYKALQAGLLAGEKATGVSVSGLTGMTGPELSTLLGGEGDPWQALADAVRSATAEQAGTEAAALALQRELGLGQLEVAQGQLTLAEETQAFKEEAFTAQQLMEAAGLATGPTGAIQLAYLAREQGAPQAEIASIFQNLPFIQELLHGQNIPGFGRPEQLGEPTPRVPSGAAGGGGLSQVGARPPGTPSGAIHGQGLGVTIPGKKSITRQAFGTLSEFEQAFLGALGQSETGQGAAGFLQDIMKSFIPTKPGGALSIS